MALRAQINRKAQFASSPSLPNEILIAAVDALAAPYDHECGATDLPVMRDEMITAADGLGRLGELNGARPGTTRDVIGEQALRLSESELEKRCRDVFRFANLRLGG